MRIATELKVTRNTVREWRARWQADGDRRAAVASERETLQPLANLIETSLGDAYRSGSPGKFSAEQVAQIIAIACEDPQVSGYPVSHWTPKEIGMEAVKRGVVERISQRQVGRFLKRGGLETAPDPLLAQHDGKRPGSI